ncbi:hypothetical protein JCM19047_1259 [Bacillus sp. JCM 19047]|nr:hypothetical protein JCM19047_1259 [Bacillus sp. JCM 19047]
MLIFVVLCLVFMFPMQAFASVTVDDEANFFSAEEIAAIEAAQTIHTLIIMSLQ